MSAQLLLSQLQNKGVRFETQGEGFRVLAPRGLITPELRDQLADHKPEILTLLNQTDVGIAVKHIVGNCPHCRQPLLVFTHLLDEEVWIQCPAKSALFKAIRHEAREWCRDCRERLMVIAGRCAECIQRLMLAPDDLCSICGGLRFWRGLAKRNKPPGFGWHCANCKEPIGKVAIYELTERSEYAQ